LKNRKENLEQIIEALEKKVHKIISEDREGQFLINHRGETITLVFNNDQTISGELLDMDKNRIVLLENETEIAYYKHAIKGYYKNNPSREC